MRSSQPDIVSVGQGFRDSPPLAVRGKKMLPGYAEKRAHLGWCSVVRQAAKDTRTVLPAAKYTGDELPASSGSSLGHDTATSHNRNHPSLYTNAVSGALLVPCSDGTAAESDRAPR